MSIKHALAVFVGTALSLAVIARVKPLRDLVGI